MSPLRLLSRIDRETPACTQTVAQLAALKHGGRSQDPKRPERAPLLEVSCAPAHRKHACASPARQYAVSCALPRGSGLSQVLAQHKHPMTTRVSDLTLPDECAVCIIEASVPMHAPLAPCALVGHLGAVPMIQRSPPLALLRGVVAGLNANSHSRESKPQWGRKREKERERARASESEKEIARDGGREEGRLTQTQPHTHTHTHTHTQSRTSNEDAGKPGI